jgi:hypothetical protein
MWRPGAYFLLARGILNEVEMGFFDRFRNRRGRYVSEKTFRKNVAKQTEMSPQTLRVLREHGVEESRELSLEFFFYTDSEEKACALAQRLGQLEYSVEGGPSAHDSKTFVITGWTTKMRMDETTVTEWTRKMCELGYEHDCEFDGWGTNPEQG